MLGEEQVEACTSKHYLASQHGHATFSEHFTLGAASSLKARTKLPMRVAHRTAGAFLKTTFLRSKHTAIFCCINFNRYTPAPIAAVKMSIQLLPHPLPPANAPTPQLLTCHATANQQLKQKPHRIFTVRKPSAIRSFTQKATKMQFLCSPQKVTRRHLQLTPTCHMHQCTGRGR